MRAKTVLGTALLAGIAMAGASFGQSEPEQVYGAFHASCKTDGMTDKRTCNVDLKSDFSYHQKGYPTFIVSFNPKTTDLLSASVPRMRVDKQTAIVADCTGTICLYARDKKSLIEVERFLKELTTGTTLHIEVSRDILDFDLADYRKALEAMDQMEKAGTPKAP